MGAALLSYGAYPLASRVIGRIASIDWYQHAGVQHLCRWLDSGDMSALNELIARIEAEKLRDSRTLAMKALAIQLQDNHPLPSETRFLLASLCNRYSVFNPTLREQYYRQLVSPVIRIRTPIAPGDPLLLRIEFENSGSRRFPLRVAASNELLEIGDVKLTRELEQGWHALTGRTSLSFGWNVNRQSPLPIGSHCVRYSATFTIFDQWSSQRFTEIRVTHARLDVSPSDPIRSESIDGRPRAIDRALEINADTRGAANVNPGIAVKLSLTRPFELDLAFEVSVVDHDGSTECLGTFSCPRGDLASKHFRVRDKKLIARALNEQAVTVRLTASRNVAANTFDCWNILDGTHESRVPLEPQPPDIQSRQNKKRPKTRWIPPF